MKQLVILCLLLSAAFTAIAQQIGVNTAAGVRGTIKLSKKSALDIRQQIQVNPEIKKYNNKYGDFFNEEGFWPIPDRYKDKDDSTDEDDFPDGAGTGIPDNPGELNDQPWDISFGWRSSSTVQYNYRMFKWLRGSFNYNFVYDGDELRNTFRTEVDYRPFQHQRKKKREIDVSIRTQFQYAGQPDDGSYTWKPSLVPRFNLEWNINKNHALLISYALNGAWDDGIFEFDRWRINPQFTQVYKKNHRFTLGYQFQQRIDRPDKVSHGISFSYEIRLSGGSSWAD
jgi:hypothetical protein